MSSLQELIDKHSQPDILLDSCISSRQKYAAWGFEEIIEINDQGCFLNNELVNGDYFKIIQDTISRWKNESNHALVLYPMNLKNSSMSILNFLKIQIKNFHIYGFVNQK